jgi:putative DNA primase/helicase
LNAPQTNIEAQFGAALAAFDLNPPEIVADGVRHRFDAADEKGKKSAWYILYADGVPAGAFGNWKTDLSEKWCSKSDQVLTPTERAEYRAKIEQARQDADATRLQLEAEAAAVCVGVLAGARDATDDNPYCVRKQIKPYGLKEFKDKRTLIVPIRDAAGTVTSLQFIYEDGTKRLKSHGRVKGCYYSFGGKPVDTLLVCEGFATGASLHAATGYPVAVAFNAGNLEPVTRALRDKLPGVRIIVCADDDRYSASGNKGMACAKAAALAVSGWLAVPDFHADDRDSTDFNDMLASSGKQAVAEAVSAAVQLTGKIRSATSVTAERSMIHSDTWPEPTPLPDTLPPVMPFDAELLPLALRGWVMDIAHRMQCPPDFAAVGAVVALSSLIGARAVVRPKERDDWQVVPNLWGLIVGRPGVMKSPALSEALKPLNRLQVDEFDRWQAAHDAWTIDQRVAEMQGADNEKKAKALASKNPDAARALLQPVEVEGEPAPRRFIVNDATVEKLGELLRVNTWGTLSYRDELYGLLTGMDRQGQEGSRAFYLQSYDGNQGYTFDRIGRGTIHIPRVCLSMIGGIQPGRVQEYVRGAVSGGSADDGLLQRFGLTVWPDTHGEFRHVDQWPDTPAKQAAWDVFNRLSTLESASDTDPAVWRFTPAAQEIFVEWRIPFEQELKTGELHPAMESHLAKYRKLVPALALVFALVDTPDSGGLIDVQELLRALAWSEYLRSHAGRLYSAAMVPEIGGAVVLLKRIRAGALGNEFTPRQVAQKGWSGLNSPDAVRKAADTLCEYDWLRQDVQTSTDAHGRGRPSARYVVNPAALPGGEP